MGAQRVPKEEPDQMSEFSSLGSGQRDWFRRKAASRQISGFPTELVAGSAQVVKARCHMRDTPSTAS
jgi:hypothetical protein